jgi:hypothetical protein
VQGLEKGYPIIVTLEGGEQYKAAFHELSEEGLLLIEEDGNVLNLPKSYVKKVESRNKRKNDGLGNGAIWGAAVGGAIPAIALASCDGCDTGFAVAAILLYSGIGMGIGVGVDAIVKSRQVFYQAPTK